MASSIGTRSFIWKCLLRTAIGFLVLALLAPATVPPSRATLASEALDTSLSGVAGQVVETGTIQGYVYMQGRNVHSDIIVVAQGATSEQRYSVMTASNGHYAITNVLPGTYCVTAWMPGYLLGVQSNVLVQGGEIVALNITLRGGDVVPDGVVDIQDLTLIGTYFNLTPMGSEWAKISWANANMDSRVDIVDLAMTGLNFGERAPLPQCDIASGILAKLSSASTPEEMANAIGDVLHLTGLEETGAFTDELVSSMAMPQLGGWSKPLGDAFGSAINFFPISQSLDEIVAYLNDELQIAWINPLDPLSLYYALMAVSEPYLPRRAPVLSATTQLTAVQTVLFAAWLGGFFHGFPTVIAKKLDKRPQEPGPEETVLTMKLDKRPQASGQGEVAQAEDERTEAYIFIGDTKGLRDWLDDDIEDAQNALQDHFQKAGWNVHVVIGTNSTGTAFKNAAENASTAAIAFIGHAAESFLDFECGDDISASDDFDDDGQSAGLLEAVLLGCNTGDPSGDRSLVNELVDNPERAVAPTKTIESHDVQRMAEELNSEGAPNLVDTSPGSETKFSDWLQNEKEDW